MVHQRGEEEPRRVGVSLDTSAVVSAGCGLHLFLGDPLPLSILATANYRMDDVGRWSGDQ